MEDIDGIFNSLTLPSELNINKPLAYTPSTPPNVLNNPGGYRLDADIAKLTNSKFLPNVMDFREFINDVVS